MLAVTVAALASSNSDASAQRRGALERWLAQAEQATARGNDRRAWSLWQRAATRQPADGRAASRMAATLPADPALAARPTEAVRARARAVEASLRAHLAATEGSRDARSLESHRAMAWARAILGEHEGAIDAVTSAAGLQDEAAHGLLRRLAAVSIHRNDLDAAHRALVAAHRAVPQDAGALSDLGALELALGRPAAAVERFTRVLGGRPDDLEARRDLAGALIAAARADEAVALLAGAVRAHPDDAELRLELARAALEAGQPVRAEQEVRLLLSRLGDADGRGHATLGEALAAQGRREEAEAAFREALRRDPGDLRARRGLDALTP